MHSTGLEPVRGFPHRALNTACLPISTRMPAGAEDWYAPGYFCNKQARGRQSPRDQILASTQAGQLGTPSSGTADTMLRSHPRTRDRGSQGEQERPLRLRVGIYARSCIMHELVVAIGFEPMKSETPVLQTGCFEPLAYATKFTRVTIFPKMRPRLWQLNPG